MLYSSSFLNDLINLLIASLFKSFGSNWDDAQWAIQDPTKSDADILLVWLAITPKINYI